MENNLNETEIQITQDSPVDISLNNESEQNIAIAQEASVIRGVDGFSPIAKVTQESDGARITITDLNGTTTAFARNGERGEKGERGERGVQGERGEQGVQGVQGERGEQGIQGVAGADGFSPIATVTKSGDTATISITDKNGTTTSTISDGTTPTIDSSLSWTSTNPLQNQVIRNSIWVKNSSGDKEAGINIAFSNPNVSPYVHLGSKTSATRGNNSVGIGNNAEASAVRSVAIGNAATASKREGVALGPNATAGQYSLSIGYYTSTVPNYSTAVGPYAKVLTGATNATAIGYQSEASEAETVSVGKSTNKRRIVNVADGTTASDVATVGQIPTKTSDLTNDGASGTSTFVEASSLATVATTGAYSDLTGYPSLSHWSITIPSTLTVSQGNNYTFNDVTGSTLNFTAVLGGVYLVLLNTSVGCSGGASECYARAVINGNVVASAMEHSSASNKYVNLSSAQIFTASQVSNTAKIQIGGSVGNTNYYIVGGSLTSVQIIRIAQYNQVVGCNELNHL